ncbi:gliding motility-associated ABC transporter substrate-binding protein GldG [Muriicola sp. Z0-33]|uniref:gliding motility-associated ABC transporter substrate-binding protein GldG n=1 Tax=Muriicola sp. Z0-33 TaxID=2816957 RepID=UPI0022375D16|nr:gliding motility-associated ABC transporter substrate-binding protein GldG [Muriicola sp. Z0-33]MCW5515559.1 gliding motility-associated ABC transporter substrate-binding protein GldG [Muriicola sp. Z0-33]
MKKSAVFSIVKVVILLVIINVAGHYFYARFDLTEDRRYTLSQAAIDAVSTIENPVVVDVLLDGDQLPSEFIRLRQETKQILEEFASENKNIKFSFINPKEDPSQAEVTMAQLESIGLKPANVTTEDNGKVSQEKLFPWAMVTNSTTTVKVPLLKNKLGAAMEDRINNSVQNLEYAFADAFTKLGIKEKKRIAVIKGNGELADISIADYLSAIRDYYNIGAITLDSVATNPQNVLDQLKTYDLAIIAKPTEAFTDAEKYVLDQFVVDGGKSLWLVDQVAIELDSLFNPKGSAMAYPRELNLNDFFFSYGLRINPVLVSDLYFTQIVLASGEGNSSQYNPVPWYYNPMVFSRDNHPITNNLEAVRFQFSNTIDTLKNNYKKTILYWSSPLSRPEGTPKQISLDIINTPPDKAKYNEGNLPLAVLVEGEFSSAFANRVKPLNLSGVKEKGVENKMLVIADGDLIKNQLRGGIPLELGFDKWTNNFYGNKEFLINAINYQLDDTGLINIRNKKVTIPLLDQNKILEQKRKWQLINIGLPVVIVIIFGMTFNYFRKKKYGS